MLVENIKTTLESIPRPIAPQSAAPQPIALQSAASQPAALQPTIPQLSVVLNTSQ